MNKKHLSFNLDIPWPHLGRTWTFARKWLLPNPGTLILMVILALAMPVLAGPLRSPSATSTSTSTISYQGRLANSAGNPLTGKYNLEFRLYDAPTGGTSLWTEYWTGGNAVDVSDGLFNVMLGSINNTLPTAIQGHNELYLGITVGTDSEMTPRVQLGSVPFSMQALTVADGSVTTAKLASGAATTDKLGNTAVTTGKIADGAVTQKKAPYLAAVPWSDRKIVIGTWVGSADGNGMATIDISSYGFSQLDGIVAVNGDDGVAGGNMMVNIYSWIGTTSFQVRCWRNGAVVPNVYFRVNYAIMGQ